MAKKRVLISGASIAGPTLAYWLDRYGFDVTVVERSESVRGGGYPIDIRGTALEVIDRMGIRSAIERAHINNNNLTFVRGDGKKVASFDPEALTGGVRGRDFEVSRGALTSALVSVIPDSVKLMFRDSIATLEDTGNEVNITFEGGRSDSYDLVIAADGLHSRVRELVFGPEEPFHNYIGYCFAGFSIPNFLGMEHSSIIWNEPGLSASLLVPGESDTLHAFLTFHREDPPFDEYRDPEASRRLVAENFKDKGWHIQEMVDRMLVADDLFFDVVSQIRMPTWSSGRVVLAGDAAHATSFMSGQGSSVALVGAYVLGNELGTRADYREAFASYEKAIRPFAEQNQALVEIGKHAITPITPTRLFIRNLLFKLMPLLIKLGLAGRDGKKANVGLTLPEYDAPPAKVLPAAS
jgi:2-polyprenyl-6-methoxyphenol hydroxylase-like FAD-dependent oxidoreductase